MTSINAPLLHRSQIARKRETIRTAKRVRLSGGFSSIRDMA
ncbi:hypothetical protein [Burkholderia cepacia]|nr:hypothetical protein [Burkholderia cepacia]QOH36753.1 hypothetical protein C7S14_8022 [Burkholderia cepacia]